MCLAEFQKIVRHKLFSTIPGGYEAKLFASRFEDATVFGLRFFQYDAEPFFIVKVILPDEHFRICEILPLDEALGVEPSFCINPWHLLSFNKIITIEPLNFVGFNVTL